MDYRDFLARKLVTTQPCGINARAMPASMKPHQVDATEFALRVGRAGNFLDTGLGKTFCEFEFSQQALEASNGRALILTPLAVAKQIEREAKKFGYDARVIRSQAEAKSGINICNYDRLEKLDPEYFGVVVLDESSILKSFVGSVSRSIREAFRAHRFRLSATATPAPNDHMELGQHSEFLSVMSAVEMLSMFFINDTSTASQEWRLKGHAERAFWDWMASWACMAESPADFGHDASEYILPPLEITRHRADGDFIIPKDGLFADMASATNMFEIKKKTCEARAQMAAKVILSDLFGEGHVCLADINGNQKLKLSEMPSTHIDGPSSPNQIPSTESECLKVASGGETAQMSDSQIISRVNSASNSKIISPCSSARTAPAPFAEQERPAETAGGTSIIATSPDESGDCSAITVMSPLDFSGRTQKILSEPSVISASRMPESWVLWCDTNEEQRSLERTFGDLAISITGSQSAEQKEELHEAWLARARPILITKVSIFGYGVNWQHCNRMFFLGRSFSYETWYQAVRRCWRFGQKRPVHVHIAVAEGEDQIARVIERKSADHIKMKRMMADSMRRALGREAKVKTGYEPKHYEELPQWLMAS